MLREPEPASRDYVGELSDPKRWNAFQPRIDDVVVCTPPKSGTTWTQGILALLISGDPLVNADTAIKSPWIDITVREIGEVMDRLAAQDHRRQVKTHTPLDGIPVWPDLRYITVYRHPIDVHFSMRKHNKNMNLDVMDKYFPDDLSEGFRIFLEGEHSDAVSLDSIINHYRQTLVREPRENILRLHYKDMLVDLAEAVAQISGYVGISHPPELMAKLVEAATFDSMRTNAYRFTPSAGQGFWQNDKEFFSSASSNKWEGKLTPDDLAAYDARISQMLSPEERAWLEWGGRA